MGIYHLNKNEQSASKEQSPLLNEKIKKKIDEFLDDPKITVNGKEIRYKSFEELKASKYYTLMTAIMRMVGRGQDFRKIEAYAEEQARLRIKDKSLL